MKFTLSLDEILKKSKLRQLYATHESVNHTSSAGGLLITDK